MDNQNKTNNEVIDNSLIAKETDKKIEKPKVKKVPSELLIKSIIDSIEIRPKLGGICNSAL